jgi:hypothetical protein
MSEQTNLTSGFETYRHPADTAFFTYNEQDTEGRVDLHASDLPSKEEGLRRAREKIAATFGGERPNEPTPQFKIVEVGSHLADLRALKRKMAEGGSDENFAFREVPAAFDRRTLRTLENDLLNGESEESRRLRAANDEFQRNAAQMDQASRPQQTVQTDMMGYELTNTGK